MLLILSQTLWSVNARIVQRLCKPRAEHQACLNVMPRCSQSYAKIVQTESRISSLFECSAEVQPILCKDCANREQNIKLA